MLPFPSVNHHRWRIKCLGQPSPRRSSSSPLKAVLAMKVGSVGRLLHCSNPEGVTCCILFVLINVHVVFTHLLNGMLLGYVQRQLKVLQSITGYIDIHTRFETECVKMVATEKDFLDTDSCLRQ